MRDAMHVVSTKPTISIHAEIKSRKAPNLGELTMHHSEGFLKLVNAAKAKIKQTTIDQVKKRMDVGEKICLIDVREESEWAEGHIKGALYLGKGVIERDIEVKFPDLKKELIFYCGGGFRSALVCESLQKMGYQKVISMDGGWRGWNEKNYTIEK